MTTSSGRELIRAMGRTPANERQSNGFLSSSYFLCNNDLKRAVLVTRNVSALLECVSSHYGNQKKIS